MKYTKEELEKLPPFNPLKIIQELSKIASVFGAVGAITSTAMFLVFVALGHNPWSKVAVKAVILDAGVSLLVIVFLLLYIRQFRKLPILKLWEGLYAGTITVVVCAVFSGIMMYFVSENFGQKALNDYKAEMTEKFSDIKLELETKKDSILVAEDSTFYWQRYVTLSDQLKKIPEISSWDMAFDEIIKKMLFGFFIVPLASLILRRN